MDSEVKVAADIIQKYSSGGKPVIEQVGDMVFWTPDLPMGDEDAISLHKLGGFPPGQGIHAGRWTFFWEESRAFDNHVNT